MFRRLDDFLIDRAFQPVAHAVQIRTGVTAYRLASRCFQAALGLLAVSAASGVREWLAAPPGLALPVGLGAAAWCLAIPVLWLMFRRWSRIAEARDGAPSGLMNDLRPRLYAWRTSVLLTLPLFVPWAALLGVWPDASFVVRLFGWIAYLLGVYRIGFQCTSQNAQRLAGGEGRQRAERASRQAVC